MDQVSQDARRLGGLGPWFQGASVSLNPPGLDDDIRGFELPGVDDPGPGVAAAGERIGARGGAGEGRKSRRAA